MLSGDVAPGAVEQEAAGRFPEIAPQVLAAARRVLTGESWSLRELSLLAGVTQAGEKLGLPPGKLERLTELALSAESEGIGSDAVLTVFFIREEQPEPKPHLLLHGANLPFAFDRSVTVAFSVSLRETAEALKINHRELFPGLKEAFSE